MREHDILDEVTSYSSSFYQYPTFDILQTIATKTRSPGLLETFWKRVTVWYQTDRNGALTLINHLVANPIAPSWLIEEAADYGATRIMIRLDKVINAPSIVAKLYNACKQNHHVSDLLAFSPDELRPSDLHHLANLMVMDKDTVNLERLARMNVEPRTIDLLLESGAVPTSLALSLLNKSDCPRKLLRTVLGIDKELPDPTLWNLVAKQHVRCEERIAFFKTLSNRPDFNELFEEHFRGDTQTLLNGLRDYRCGDQYRNFNAAKRLLMEIVESAYAVGNVDAYNQNLLTAWVINKPDQFSKAEFEQMFASLDWQKMMLPNIRAILVHKHSSPELAKKLKPAFVYRIIESSLDVTEVMRSGKVGQFQLAIWIALLESKQPRRELQAWKLRERKDMLARAVDLATSPTLKDYAGPELLRVLYKALSRTNDIESKVKLAEDDRLDIRLVKQAAKSKVQPVADAALQNLQRRQTHVNPVPAQLASVP